MSVKNSIIVQKLVFRLPLVVRNEVVIRPPLLFTTQNHYPDLGEWFMTPCFTDSSKSLCVNRETIGTVSYFK